MFKVKPYWDVHLKGGVFLKKGIIHQINKEQLFSMPFGSFSLFFDKTELIGFALKECLEALSETKTVDNDFINALFGGLK